MSLALKMELKIETLSEVEASMRRIPNVDNLRHWSKLYSSKPHLAGDLAHAQSICDLWTEYGVPSKLVRYDVLQNFPISTSLALQAEGGSVKYQARLEEEEVSEDPTSSPKNGLPAFHGFSANGDVCGKLIYANFGTIADFELLAARGISLKGKIVICKYSKVFRGLKVRAAERFGAIGVIIYNDPQEDGQYTTANGYEHYPHGPARHPSSIQRGSVDFFSVCVGDPTTPGYPSMPGNETNRKDPYHAIPGIPSLPISFADATPFLHALNQQGSSPFEIGGKEGDWKGGIAEVDYYTGPSTLDVHLTNKGDYSYSPIYNVIGIVEGVSDETIILGNHHDSWCCGAIDPISGSTAMNEVARGLGRLTAMGWRPNRSIFMASWDNEEYGLVGSTEWGEENAEWLSKTCIAYINVDESTNGGAVLGVTGSPLLADVLRSVARTIPSPLSDAGSVYDDWLGEYQRSFPNAEIPNLTAMGTGSDYTVMMDHLGIPSLDLLFNQRGSGVYPYHSNYDSYYWVDKFGDVGFRKHLAMTQLWGVLAVRLAGSDVIPFTAMEYHTVLLENTLSLAAKTGFDLSAIVESLNGFQTAAISLDKESQRLRAFRDSVDGSDVGIEASTQALNHRYKMIERAFISEEGLPGRPWYKHIIFAPGLWKGYDGVVFPGLVEALDLHDITEAAKWANKIARVISNASYSMAL